MVFQHKSQSKPHNKFAMKSHVISLWGHSISCAFYTSRRKKWRADSTWVSSILTAVIHYQALIFAVYWTSVRAWCLCRNWKVYRVWSVSTLDASETSQETYRAKKLWFVLQKTSPNTPTIASLEGSIDPTPSKVYSVFDVFCMHQNTQDTMCVCVFVNTMSRQFRTCSYTASLLNVAADSFTSVTGRAAHALRTAGVLNS